MAYATLSNATFEEITCGSALTRSTRHSGWSLNPYRAGQQAGVRGCVYRDREHVGAPTERIVVKTNLVEVLRREMNRASWRCEHVTIGTECDPYHPAEQQYGLTHGALEVLLHSRTPCSVVTKSPDILRDLSILQELSVVAACSVQMRLATLREDVWRHIEPETANPARRLEAVARLAAAGIRCGVLLDPVIVGLTDGPENVQSVAWAAHEHGATFEGGSMRAPEEASKERLVAAARGLPTGRFEAEVPPTAPGELLEPWRTNRLPVREVRHRGQLALAI